MSDQELYRAILTQDADAFLSLTDEIAGILRREAIDCVVGDAVEGANPGHDLCRLMLNAALLRVEQNFGRRVRNLEFPLEGAPDGSLAGRETEIVRLRLDDDAYRRKFAAAEAYPELAAEMARTLTMHDPDTFRIESLRPVHYGLEIDHLFEHPPLYERYGAQQVAAGLYRDVIRFREHLAPLARRLGEATPH